MAENGFRRFVAWFKRAKTTPAVMHQVADVQHDHVRDVQTVGAQVAALSERVVTLENELLGELERMRELGARQAELNLMATMGLARDAGMQQLLQVVGEQRPLRPGLSILTISWNHAAFVQASVRSALATLDLLPPDEQGTVLVLDDNSSDETARVLEELRVADGRVHPIRSPVNLGLSRARNVLLHVTETTHALMLDADNTAVPEGVIALYLVAREWDAAFTFGNVVMTAPDGSTTAVASNEPLTTDYFFAGGPHIDTLGVLDVAYFRQVGGYNPDPAFHAFDDHEIIHRLARLGALLAFVPTVAGRYRFDRLSHSQIHQGSHEATIARLRRAYDQDGRLTSQPPNAMAAHPATGPLWATPPAVAARPELEKVAPADDRDYDSEIAFWRTYLVAPTGILDAGSRRAAFPRFLLPFLDELGNSPRLLELGSGPVSLLAWGVDEGIMNVTAVDPLARTYNEMMTSRGFHYPVRPIEGYGEQLLNDFERGEFDAAYTSNALDHAASPGACLRNLAAVVRPGGFVCVEGLEREGSSGGWEGLHGHDLISSDGRLLCIDREGHESDLTTGLDLRCVFETVRPFPERGLASHGYEYDPTTYHGEKWWQRNWYSMIFRVS